MAKRKDDRPATFTKEWWAEEKASEERWKELHPVIRQVWRIVETLPATSWYDNEYGDYHTTPSKTISVSPWFDTDEEAQAWADEREPDKDCVFTKSMISQRHIPATTGWFSGDSSISINYVSIVPPKQAT